MRSKAHLFALNCPNLHFLFRYKQLKAKLGMRKVRPWKWMAFTNPARRDALVLYHWRRVADEAKEYPFAKFNKRIETPQFTEAEYLVRYHFIPCTFFIVRET